MKLKLVDNQPQEHEAVLWDHVMAQVLIASTPAIVESLRDGIEQTEHAISVSSGIAAACADAAVALRRRRTSSIEEAEPQRIILT